MDHPSPPPPRRPRSVVLPLPHNSTSHGNQTIAAENHAQGNSTSSPHSLCASLDRSGPSPPFLSPTPPPTSPSPPPPSPYSPLPAPTISPIIYILSIMSNFNPSNFIKQPYTLPPSPPPTTPPPSPFPPPTSTLLRAPLYFKPPYSLFHLPQRPPTLPPPSSHHYPHPLSHPPPSPIFLPLPHHFSPGLCPRMALTASSSSL